MRTSVAAGLMLVLCSEWTWAQPGQPPAATTTIEVVNDKKKFDMLVPAHRLLVVVKSGTVAAIDVRVTELAGGSVDPKAVTFTSPKGTFAGGNWIEVPVTVNAAPFARLGPGSFDLVGVVQASDTDGKVLVSVPLSMTLVRAERQLTPPSTPVALRVRRARPFSSVETVHCLQLRATPAGPLPPPAVDRASCSPGARPPWSPTRWSPGVSKPARPPYRRRQTPHRASPPTTASCHHSWFEPRCQAA